MPWDIETYRTRREDQWFDRKSARVRARSLADDLIGLANAEGGTIVIGIAAGEIEGTSNVDTNTLRQAARDFTQPVVRHTVTVVDCVTAMGRSDELLVFEVEPSEDIHRNVNDEVFLRVGDENRKLRALEAQELAYDKGQSVYDRQVVRDATLDDFDSDLVARYCEHVRVAGNQHEALVARGLARVSSNELMPTVAGMLVLGREPQRHFPEAYVRLLEYRGRTRQVGSRANVVSDVRLEGTLGDQIDHAQAALRERIPSLIRLAPTGRFAASQIIPEPVWLEALVNAVIHRSYSMGGDHIRIELFEDRAEVESPGRLPGLVRLDNIRSTRFARNPRIARALADLGYGRKLGEGVDRMFEEMNRAGLPDPVFEQRPASVKVALLADRELNELLEGLPAPAVRLAEHASRLGSLRTVDAVSLLRVSRPTALRHLHSLADRGILEHTGSSLSDPRGTWQFVDPNRRPLNT